MKRDGYIKDWDMIMNYKEKLNVKRNLNWNGSWIKSDDKKET
jgi:hypothetical protein